MHHTPVNLLTLDEKDYLVAARGETEWVRNVRAADGNLTLILGRHRQARTATEVPVEARAEILRAYLRRWKFEVGMFFEGVGPDSTDAEFAVIARATPGVHPALTRSTTDPTRPEPVSLECDRPSSHGPDDAGSAMSDENEVRLGHQNLIDYSRASTQWASRGSLHQDRDALFYAGGSWIPVVGNGAFRTDDAVEPEDFLDRTDAFFSRRKRGYSIKVRDNGEDDDLRAACEAHGLVPLGEPTPQMICHHRLDTPALPGGISLRAVRDEQGVADFAAVNADAYGTYGMPAEVFVQLFDRPQRLLADVQTAVVVAYRRTEPSRCRHRADVSAVAGWRPCNGSAPSRPPARLGLGRVVTVWATNAAFDMGATSVTLQASPMGEPLYAKLGYETRYHYRDYVCWTAPVPPTPRRGVRPSERQRRYGVPPRLGARR